MDNWFSRLLQTHPLNILQTWSANRETVSLVITSIIQENCRSTKSVLNWLSAANTWRMKDTGTWNLLETIRIIWRLEEINSNTRGLKFSKSFCWSIPELCDNVWRRFKLRGGGEGGPPARGSKRGRFVSWRGCNMCGEDEFSRSNLVLFLVIIC